MSTLIGQRLFRLGSRLSVAVPLDPMTLFSAGHGAGFTTCSLVVGWREEGGGGGGGGRGGGGGHRLVVRTHIERKELESRPRLTVAPGNGLERCSPMRRRWLRGHRPCVGSYGPLQLGVSIVRQCPSCLCRSGWQENSGRRSGQRQGARQVKPGAIALRR